MRVILPTKKNFKKSEKFDNDISLSKAFEKYLNEKILFHALFLI